MIVLVDSQDNRAIRNKDNVLALYEMMINQKKSEEATAKFVSPVYVQHNPLIPDGSVALGQFFGKVTRERRRASVVVHRLIAVDDYVWAHVNFLNLFNDEPHDTNMAWAIPLPLHAGEAGSACLCRSSSRGAVVLPLARMGRFSRSGRRLRANRWIVPLIPRQRQSVVGRGFRSLHSGFMGL